jgi:hypothetical protein
VDPVLRPRLREVLRRLPRDGALGEAVLAVKAEGLRAHLGGRGRLAGDGRLIADELPPFHIAELIDLQPQVLDGLIVLLLQAQKPCCKSALT